jgi:NADH dehydrogenase
VIDALKVYDVNKFKQTLQIDLIEAGPRILPALPERIAESAAKELTKIGVTIHTDTRITQANESGFVDANEMPIKADMMVWAAGVKVQSWLKDTDLELNRINQIECLPSLKCKSDDNIYVIGDCCAINMADGSKVPPRAQAAHQMASIAAKNIIRELQDKSLVDFKYTDYGSLVNLSRYSTVGSLMGNLVKGSMFIEGKIARFMYLSLYRMHQLTIHGYAKGPFIIALSRISKLIRPKIKLH